MVSLLAAFYSLETWTISDDEASCCIAAAMGSLSRTFQYVPLPIIEAEDSLLKSEIRLLRLHPGKFEDPIYCGLHHVRFQKVTDRDIAIRTIATNDYLFESILSPEFRSLSFAWIAKWSGQPAPIWGHDDYTAVSYVWGKPDKRLAIKIGYSSSLPVLAWILWPRHIVAIRELMFYILVVMAGNYVALAYMVLVIGGGRVIFDLIVDFFRVLEWHATYDLALSLPLMLSEMFSEKNHYADMEVTVNLERALRHLRHPSIPRMLWIDALCIDQSNLEERSEQVDLMGLIYSKATEVRIWLGDLSTKPKGAVDAEKTLRALAQRSERIIAIPRNCELPLETDEVEGLRYVASLAWWRRMWVIQEAVLTKRKPMMQYGTITFSYVGVQEIAVSRIQQLRKLHCESSPEYRELAIVRAHIGLARYHRVFNIDKLSATDQIIHYMGMTAGQFHATDERDRVYALLGLLENRKKAHWSERIGVLPLATMRKKYGNEKTIFDLQRAVVMNALKDDHPHARPLRFLAYGPSMVEGKPTWIPSWAEVYHVPRLETSVPRSYAELLPGDDGHNMLELDALNIGQALCIIRVPMYETLDTLDDGQQTLLEVEDCIWKSFDASGISKEQGLNRIQDWRDWIATFSHDHEHKSQGADSLILLSDTVNEPTKYNIRTSSRKPRYSPAPAIQSILVPGCHLVVGSHHFGRMMCHPAQIPSAFDLLIQPDVHIYVVPESASALAVQGGEKMFGDQRAYRYVYRLEIFGFSEHRWDRRRTWFQNQNKIERIILE